MMRRAFLPLILVIAVSAISVGMVIGASSGAKDPATVPANTPVVQWAATPGTTQSQVEAAPILETINLTANLSGNKRYPGVGENVKGDRLVVFRGNDNYFWYTWCKKGGSWSAPAYIPNQPLISIAGVIISNVEVEADSTGRFHCAWDEPKNYTVYGSFLDGVWSNLQKIQMIGKTDNGASMVVRSTDEVLLINNQIIGGNKEVILYSKAKNAAQFGAYTKNLTGDPEGSCQGWMAVDSKDNIWVVWKSDYQYNPAFPDDDKLVTFLGEWDKSNKLVDPPDPSQYDWQIMSEKVGWSFWPAVAANTDGKIMTLWAYSTAGDYNSRLYNPATPQIIYPLVKLNNGLSLNPWCTFWSRLVAHGKDFYAAVMNPGRILFLKKYNEAANKWDDVAQITTVGTDNFDLYSGYDKLLIAWSPVEDPAGTGIFLTTVSVDPLTPPTKTLTVQAGTGGTTNPVPGAYTYTTGSSVTVRAVADANYRFNSWSGDATGTADSITITLDSDKTIQANFTRQQTLTMQTGAGGTTIPAPGTYRYDKDSSVSVRATPDASYLFTFWSGDASGATTPVNVTLDRDKTVKANFRLKVQSAINLTVEKKIERGFFNAYYLNVLSWAANPENTDQGVVIVLQRIYRKLRTESYAQWTRLAEVAPGILTYVDRNVPRTSDYVYAVACVDANGNESLIY